MKILVVVDMQNDFITGALGTAEARKIIPNVFSKVKEYAQDGDWQKDIDESENIIFGLPSLNNESTCIIFTQDTHSEKNYNETEEGKNLPVAHCLKGTKGWELISEFDYFKKYGFDFNVIRKETFGSDELILHLQGLDDNYDIESIELIGVCTDICVISNAMIAKAALPNVPIYVDVQCCAGSTVEMHDKAVDLMEKSLQVHILNKGKEPWRM